MGVDQGEERRRAARVKVEAFVKSVDGDKEYVFTTQDISSNGLFLATKVTNIYPFQIGDKLDIELYDYEMFVNCRVEVARIVASDSEDAETSPAGFGVHIVEIEPGQSDKLVKIIEKAANHDAS